MNHLINESPDRRPLLDRRHHHGAAAFRPAVRPPPRIAARCPGPALGGAGLAAHGRDSRGHRQPVRAWPIVDQGALAPRSRPGGPGLRRRLRPAQFAQIGPGAVAGRHPPAGRLYRRIALRPDQRSPRPRQAGPAADGRAFRATGRNAGHAAGQADRPSAHPLQPGRSATNPGRTRPEQAATHRRLLSRRRVRPGQALAGCALSPRWPGNWPPTAAPSGCSVRPRTTPSPRKSPVSPPASVATCAAPRRWARPSICSPWPTWWYATTPA